MIKTTIILICFVLVSAENCDHDSDCTLTTCKAGLEIDCGRHTNLCTCVPAGDNSLDTYQCQTEEECHNLFGNLHCHQETWHCIDQHCHCMH